MNRRSMLWRALAFLGVGAGAAASVPTAGPSWRPLLRPNGEKFEEVEDYVAADGELLGFVWRYPYDDAPLRFPYQAVIPIKRGHDLPWGRQYVFTGTLVEAKAVLVELLA